MADPANAITEFNETNSVQSLNIGGVDLAVSLLNCTAETNGAVRVIAQVQNLAAWAMVLITGALAAAGTIVPTLSPEQLADLTGKMRNEGVLYHGLHVLGGGSILGGLILGAVAAFIIDRKFKNAAAFALGGAVFTFFGFMHGERIGIAQSPTVAASYLIVSGILFACAKFVVVVPKAAEAPAEPHGAGVHA